MELAAMIAGFIIFWPVGLAILAWKGWKEGWWGPNARRDQNGGGMRMPWQQKWPAQGGDWGRELNRDSGNSAFEEYKDAELTRLQKEFERLADEQRAFAEHIEQLRRAKDKAEFDSFLASRRSGSQGQGFGAGGETPQAGPQTGPTDTPPPAM
jgi:hypothetical protein